MKENFFKSLKYVVLALVFIIVLVVVFYTNKDDNEEIVLETNDVLEVEPEIDEVPQKIRVDIKGEVVNPGVYELDVDTRVIDAINKSGGLTENADTNLINLSKTLSNEMVIVIYNKYEIEKLKTDLKETKTVVEYIEKECSCPDTINDACIYEYKDETSSDSSTVKDTRININTASISELTTIPGIGEAKAKAIIEYRDKTPFVTIEDIKNISGIGDSTFEKLKDYITV